MQDHICQDLHSEANRITRDLYHLLNISRMRAVNDGFDAVEEATGCDLSTCRTAEIKHLIEYENTLEDNDDGTTSNGK